MNFRKYFFLITSVWVFASASLLAQKPGFEPPPRRNPDDLYRNPVRVILNKFSITGTVGYGLVLHSHRLSNMYFYQSATNQIIRPITDGKPPLGVIQGYSNWFNRSEYGDTVSTGNEFSVPLPSLENPVFNPKLRNSLYFQNTDSLPLKFRSISHSIPLGITIHYNYQKFRIGAGAILERQYFGTFKPTTMRHVIRPFTPEVPPVFFQRYFGTVGYRYYDSWRYSFAAEAQIGIIRGGGMLSGGDMPLPAYDYSVVQRGTFFNLGLSMEQNLSEYFRIIVKPSIDYHTLSTMLNDPASTPAEVSHKQITFFVQAGVSISFPDIRRCPLSSCSIQLKHVHSGNNEIVRGQPLIKYQNPKAGQNHRKLFRFKMRNRKLINPY